MGQPGTHAGDIPQREGKVMQREKQGEAGARVEATALISWAGISMSLEWKPSHDLVPIGCRASPYASSGAQVSGPLL
jgi:hypothetical protein